MSRGFDYRVSTSMSDLMPKVQIQIDQPQTVEEKQKLSASMLNRASLATIIKGFPLRWSNISKAGSLFVEYGQYVILLIVSLVVLGTIYFLFTLNKHMIERENKIVAHMIEEKVKDALKKNLDSDKDVAEAIKQGNNDVNEQSTTVEDNSQYIIEANRLYEMGCYERATTFYEKGLDKSMSFLNADFVMYRLGDSYLMSGRYEEALDVFQTLSNDYINNPHQFKSRLKIGECYAGMGEFKKARKTLYAIMAQEGKCRSDEDKLTVVDSYFKIADYYMEESQRLRKAATGETGNLVRSLASR